MNDQLSQKLKALSFAAIILVVFIHSYNEEINFVSGELTGGKSYSVLFVENFISKGIARIAVPLFFLISGFLFYLSFNFTVSGILDKYKKRLKSLVVPYLFWSVFGLLLELFLQSLPWSRNFFTRELIADYSFSKLVNTILVDPITYQLWFIRDLIMLVMFSPIIWYLTTSTKGKWILILVVFWYLRPKTFELFSNEGLLFFTLGCFFAGNKTRLVLSKGVAGYSWYYLIAWLFIVFLNTRLLIVNGETIMLNVLNNTGILIGILAVWSLYDRFDHERIMKYSELFAYSFMIFVFHEPLLAILKKGMFYLYGKTDFSSLMIYLLAPLSAIGISMILRFLWKKYSFTSYAFATGGR